MLFSKAKYIKKLEQRIDELEYEIIALRVSHEKALSDIRGLMKAQKLAKERAKGPVKLRWEFLTEEERNCL